MKGILLQGELGNVPASPFGWNRAWRLRLRGLSATIATVLASGFLTSSLRASVELAPLTNIWRFEQTTNLDGIAWFSPGYDDSTWPTGGALLYVENNILVSPRNTPLTIGRTTYYFRTHFNAPFALTNAYVTFSCRIDDGAVFYLNGREVQRVRMSVTPTLIFYSTLATGSPSSGDAISADAFALTGNSLTNFVPGDNVLAVEVHQNVASSDDIVFGTSIIWNFTNAAPVVVSQPADVSVLDGRAAALVAFVDGNPTPTRQWFKDGQPIPGATGSFLSFTATHPTNAGTYWLIGSNIFDTATTSNAVLTVLADTNPPIIVSAVAQKNLTNILVTFSEPVRSASATNTGNYAVFQTSVPSSHLDVLGLSLSGNSAVTLRTVPRAPGLNYSLRVNGIQDISSVSNVIAPDSEVALSYRVDLIAVDALTTWRYFQAGVQPASNWVSSSYDDSAWPVGAALFHAGTPLPGAADPVRTTLALTNGGNAVQTFYFRTTFDFPGQVETNSLRLHDIADDGAVFYLNGNEAFSIGMPTNRPVPYATAAARTVGTANYEPSLTASGSVIPGTNIVTLQNSFAAEVHQSASGFSDVAFGAILDAVITRYHPHLQLSVPALTQEGAGTLTNAAHISILEPLATDLVLQASSTRPADIGVPALVTIPAGATNVEFDLVVSDDAMLNGPRTVVLTVESPGKFTASTNILFLDNETNTLNISIASSMMEGSALLSGDVRFAQAAVTNITVNLTSSDVTELTVPPSVVMPAGATSVVFQVTVVDDTLIDGAQPVTLIASVPGWPAALANVTVNDNEPTNITIILPISVVEGAGTLVATGKVQLAGIAVSNLTVELSSSLPNLVSVVSNITVNVGQSNASFDLTFIDNPLYEPPRTVVISAAISGFVSGSNTLTVLDDDAHHFVFERIPSPQYTNVPFMVTITALTAEGGRQTNFTFTGLAANGQSGEVLLQPTNVGPFVGGVWTGFVQVLTADRFVRLETMAAPGFSEPFHVEPAPYRVVDLQAEDLIYDPTRQRIYASVPSIGGIYSNSVTAIDPVTGTVVWSLPVAPIVRPETSVRYYSGKLARSDDGQFLYVAVSNALAVQRINLATQTLGPVFPVGNSTFGTALSVADLVVLPGAPTSVAVARADGFNSKGVALYDSGTRRANTTPETFPSINAIEPAANGSTLYGYNGQGSDFDFIRLSVSASGVSVLDAAQGWLNGFGADIVFDGGFLFGSFGVVIEPLTPRLMGLFNVESSFVCCKLVAPNTAMRRAFFHSQVGSNFHLQTHDLDTFLALKAFEIAGDGGFAKAFIRWGTNGLAFPTTAGKIYLVQSSLLTPSGLPADLVVTQSLAGTPVAGSNLTISVTVSNRGTEFASEVVVTDTLPPNNALSSVFLSQGSWSTNAGKLAWSVGMLPPGSNATATVTMTSPVGGWQTNRITVVGNEFDPNLTNNVSAEEYFVQVDVRPNSVSQIALPVNDFAYDPASQRLLASIPNRFGAHGNAVLMLDPTHGNPTGSLFVGNEPGRFALSENNQYLYVAANTNYSVSRIDLASQSVGLQFALEGPQSLQDMAVLPGQPQSIAISHGPLAVYDNGILRPNTGEAPSHYYSDVIEFGADASMIFVHNSGAIGFNRMSVDAQGVTFLDSDSELLGNFTTIEFEFAEGLLYSTSGLVIDPLSRTPVGQITSVTSGAAVLFDPPTRRIYYLQTSGTNCQLLAFEAGSLIPLGSMNIGGVSGTPSSLTRWGADGFAFRTSADQVFILRTSLVPINEPADLLLNLISNSPTAFVGSNYTFTLQVSNQGPSTASSVLLTNDLPSGSTVVAVAPSQGSWMNVAGRVVCNIGQLPNGASATVSVTIKPGTAGLLSFSANVDGDVLDRTNSNNHVTWLGWAASSNNGPQTIAALGFNDIAADPISSRIYASISFTGALFANCLVWIDPVTGQISQPVSLGFNPNRLAISSDGHYLYAGLDGASAVRQFDLLNQTLGPQFSLGSGQQAVDLAVSPTNSLQVVVYRTFDGKIARYDDGVKASSELGGMSLFAFSDLSGELYACDGAHSGVPLYRASSTASGLSLAESQPGHQSSTTELKSDGGLLFYNGGMVVDPVGRRVKAVMPVPFNSLVEPDVNSGRVFYLTPAGGTWTLRAFDLVQAVEIDAIAVGGMTGTPKRFVRWGSDGLAICTTSGQLVILQGKLVPSAPATDLALRQSASATSITTNDVVTFTLSLTNNGPALAQSIVVTQVFSLNVTNVTVTPSAGTAYSSNKVVTWQIGSLATGSVASLTVGLRPAQNGTLVALAAARHVFNDPSWANNAALTALGAQSLGNSNVLEIRLATRELSYDSQRDVLYASLPASNQFLGNIVGVISPITGDLLGHIFAGSEPNQLALSDDNRYLYASLNGTMGVRRIDLQGTTPDDEFELGADDMYNAFDVKVKPGQPETIAVSRVSLNTSGDYPRDVSVYNSGVRLPNTGRATKMVEFSSNGGHLFGYVTPGTGFGFLRMPLDGTGVITNEVFTSFTSDFIELKHDNGRLYTYTGKVIDPYVPLQVGSVSASGPLTVDAQAGRVFYLSQAGAAWELRAFDVATLQLIGTQAVASVQGVPGSLIRCGADRLAFRTSANQLFIVKSPLTIVDTDHDGLPDDWELAHGLNPTNSVDATLDSDCDGQLNLQEFQAGTDPLRFENLRLTSLQLDAQGWFEITMQGQAGKTYTLESSTNLTQWWHVSTFICRSSNQKIQTPYTGAGYGSFFRLQTDTNAPLPLLDLINGPSLTTNPPLLLVAAPPGRNYSLQASTNLVDWVAITNFYGLDCATLIPDAASTSQNSRFYRVSVQ